MSIFNLAYTLVNCPHSSLHIVIANYFLFIPGSKALYSRYKIDTDGLSCNMYISIWYPIIFTARRANERMQFGAFTYFKYCEAYHISISLRGCIYLIIVHILNCRFVHKLAVQLFNGDTHQAAFRILTDFRKGKFGWIALERPPR